MEIKSKKIFVVYSSIDGCHLQRVFETLADAQAFAHYYVGAHPEQGSNYAVSADGVGKVVVTGATLDELFPENVLGEQ